MVTSLPSFSLSLSVSLSLSLSHRMYLTHRKRFRASYNRKRFRASYNTPSKVVQFFTTQPLRKIRKLIGNFHFCRATCRSFFFLCFNESQLVLLHLPQRQQEHKRRTKQSAERGKMRMSQIMCACHGITFMRIIFMRVHLPNKVAWPRVCHRVRAASFARICVHMIVITGSTLLYQCSKKTCILASFRFALANSQTHHDHHSKPRKLWEGSSETLLPTAPHPCCCVVQHTSRHVIGYGAGLVFSLLGVAEDKKDRNYLQFFEAPHCVW